MQRTILSHRLFTDLRPGDTIVAIDGHPLPRPRTVTAPRVSTGGGPDAVALAAPEGSTVEHRLYPGNVARVTFDRPLFTASAVAAEVAIYVMVALLTLAVLARWTAS